MLQFYVLLPAILLGFSGCTLPDNFRDRAVDYNRSLEQASNDALLLNVIRAAGERPLYFTSFNLLRGSMSAAIGSTASANFGDDAANAKTNTTLGVNAIGNVTNSPSFDLGVLNTQEFYNGLIAPVDPALINFFRPRRGSVERPNPGIAKSSLGAEQQGPSRPAHRRGRDSGGGSRFLKGSHYRHRVEMSHATGSRSRCTA